MAGTPIALKRMSMDVAQTRNAPGLVTAGGDVLLNGQPLVVSVGDPVTERRVYTGDGVRTIAALVLTNEYLVPRSSLGSAAFAPAGSFAGTELPVTFKPDPSGQGVIMNVYGEDFLLLLIPVE